MGVWIETVKCRVGSHRLRVTPCMGVWIETARKMRFKTFYWSHPVWVCGLKQARGRICTNHGKSHPVWVCGLKHPEKCVLRRFIVSHPVWVCGLKPSKQGQQLATPCHTLYGCVDWNKRVVVSVQTTESHTLYGCVDWNIPKNAF